MVWCRGSTEAHSSQVPGAASAQEIQVLSQPVVSSIVAASVSTLRGCPGAQLAWRGCSSEALAAAMCGCGGAAEDDGEPLEDDKRSCRNLPWLLLFVAFWSGLWTCASLGLKNGDPGVLFYGLDYDGNVCNREQGAVNLVGLRNRYFLSPNEVIASRGYGFSLADASSICLGACPELLPNNTLSWVCKYPNDNSGQNVDPKLVPTNAKWESMNYNYFALLNATAKKASCQMQGPCYPVVTLQYHSFTTCSYSTLKNVPVSPASVNGLKNCYSCCQNVTQKICVYPTFSNATGAAYNPLISSQFAACMSSCESLHGSFSDIAGQTTTSIDPTANALFKSTCLAAGASSMPIPLPATMDNGAAQAVVSSLMKSQRSLIERYMGDLVTCYQALIICGLILPFIFSFMWLAVLRFFAPSLVVITIVGVNLAALAVTLYCFAKSGKFGGVTAELEMAANSTEAKLGANPALARAASVLSAAANHTAAAVTAAATAATAALNTSAVGNSTLTQAIDDHSALSKQQMYYIGIAAAVVTVLLWIFTARMSRRLHLALATLQVACDALGKVPQLALQPLVGLVAMTLFLVWWVAVALFLYSSSTITRRDCCADIQSAWKELFPPGQVGSNPLFATPDCANVHCGYTVSMKAELRSTLVYHLFGFLWNTQFIIGFTVCVVAHVTFHFYAWLGAGEAMPKWPVTTAMRIVIRFYLGSVAVGSFLMAWVQFLRMPLAFTAARLKAVEQRGKLAGPAMAAVVFTHRLCTLLVKLVNPHAYCMVIIGGKAYCDAGVEALQALEQNMHVAETVTEVANAVIFLGKVCVAACCAFWCFIYLDTLPDGAVSSPIFPVILVFATAFAIACIFFAIPELLIETVLLSFCVDCKENGGQPRFSPPVLMNAIDTHKQAGHCCGCTHPPAADDDEEGRIPKTRV